MRIKQATEGDQRITDQRYATEQIQFQASLLDQVHNAVIALDAEQHVIFWNRFAQNLYQWTVEEALGREISELIVAPAEKSNGLKVIEKIAANGYWEGEFQLQRKDGTIFPGYVYCAALLGENGKIKSYVGISADLTERKLDEEARRKMEERYRSYFQLGLVGMAITSTNKTYLEVNDKLCEILGYARNELLQLSWADITYPEDLSGDVGEFDKVIAGEIDSYVYDKRYIRKDGEIINAMISVRCLRNPDKTIDCFLALIEDVTARKRAEGALRQSEARYRDLVENSSDLICTHDLEGTVLSVNRAATHLLGYDLNDFIGKRNIRETLAPNVRDQFDAYLNTIRTAGVATGVMQVLTSTGERRIWEYHNTLRVDDGSPPIVRGMARDITDKE